MSKVLLKKIDNEYVVNIPSDMVDIVGAKEGDVLNLNVSSEKKLELELIDDKQDEILAIHEELMDEYATAFERLAK